MNFLSKDVQHIWLMLDLVDQAIFDIKTLSNSLDYFVNIVNTKLCHIGYTASMLPDQIPLDHAEFAGIVKYAHATFHPNDSDEQLNTKAQNIFSVFAETFVKRFNHKKQKDRLLQYDQDRIDQVGCGIREYDNPSLYYLDKIPVRPHNIRRDNFITGSIAYKKQPVRKSGEINMERESIACRIRQKHIAKSFKCQKNRKK